ncbi:MAG: hypothetical protein ABL955_12235, partial [Elusimicrobiota bacterium]
MSGWKLVALALILPASAHAGKRYESFLVDPVDRTATLSAPLGLMSTAKTYFDSAPLAGGRALVREFHDGALEGAYYLSDKSELIGRTDLLLVLDEDFGRVYASISADYASGAGRIKVNTKLHQRDVAGQRASSGKAPKAGHPDGFSLIRAMRAPPKFVVASADYSLDGTLVAFSVAQSSGDWVSTEGAAQPPPGFGTGYYYAPGIDVKIAAKAGLPLTIDPIRFETDPFAGLPDPSAPIATDAALIYRDHGAVIERRIKRGSSLERASLWFPPTETERGLLGAERRLPFT